ncbi:neprilysin-2-like [Venturia canescens]|uniref:neprilysin-2-like n=1 Tax=Venturia canescens TaxID=32260 RepID=UPI001C9BD6B0|nr:neprilysin-2-like [Venturia canescens]
MGNKKCWESTALVCRLTALVLLMLLLRDTPHVVKAEGIGDGRDTSNSCSPEDQCLTPECIHTASAVLRNMDPNVDPCENFYKFACGGFINETIVPNGQSQVDNFKILENEIYEQMKSKIRAKSEADEPRYLTLMKDFYQICINKSAEDPTKDPFRIELDKLGGWPVILGDEWKENEFDWIAAIHKYRNAGHFYNSLIDFRIDRPVLEFYDLDLSGNIDETSINGYYLHMVGIAALLDAELEYAIKELGKVLEFEIQLANFSSSTETPENRSEACDSMSLRLLSTTYPSVPWKQYFEGLLPGSMTVEENEDIIVCAPGYFTRLEKLLSETPKRLLANYLMWRVMETMTLRISDAPRQQSTNSTRVPKNLLERTDECIKDVFKEFPLLADAVFVKYYFNKETKKSVMEMVSNIRAQYEDTVIKAAWVDEPTRKTMLDKVTAMVDHIGYPDELLDEEKLNKMCEKLNFSGNSYSESKLKLTKFENDYKLGKLREPSNRTEWMSYGQSAATMAFYDELKNSFQLSAGILQGVFFNNERPNYMNYGAIGFVIGHEMMHSFNDGVKQFDKDGNLIDWAPETEKLWNSSVKCLAEQYGNYVVPELGIKLNGSKSQNENFADNGAIKIAYRAYNRWAVKNEPEKKLPGIDLTPKQMFWLSAANSWCVKYEPTGLLSQVISGDHSPKEFRIIGSFSNMPEFAADFKCPLDSPMYPMKNCLIW